MERDSTARDWNVRIMAAHIGSVTSAPYLLQWSHIETHVLSQVTIRYCVASDKTASREIEPGTLI